MATLLLVVIYCAYVGLGVPDSLFGTAWPAIYQELDLPVSAASAVTMLISSGTIISSFMSTRIINRFGTAIVTAVSTTLTALALLGFSQSGNFLFLCLFAIPLGLGAGTVDAAQNSYVAMHYNARQMSFLHCFYGIGVSVSPYLMSIGLHENEWRKGYMLAFTLQAVISIITIIAIPLWKKAHPQTKTEEERKAANVPILTLAKMPAVRATWMLFITSCGIEVICTHWSSTFLVQCRSFTPEIAARTTMLYFVGLAAGRFVSGLVADKIKPWAQIKIGCAVLAVGLTLLFLPVEGRLISSAGLFLVGFGIGPMYPNLTYLTPIHFGDRLSQAVIGSQMGFAYIGIMVLPIVFGFIAQGLTTAIFPYFQAVLFLLTLLCMHLLQSGVKKMKTQGE